MMWKWIVPGAVLAGILLAVSGAAAHEGHAHKFMGTVSAVHDQDLEIKTTDGKTVVFLLGAKTVYQRGKAKADVKGIRIGERVVVSALQVPAGKTMTAQTIDLPVAAAPAAARQ